MCLIVPIVYTVIAAAATIARPGSTLTCDRTPSASARVEQHTRPLGDRRRLLGADVGDAEPTSEHELGQPQRHREPCHHLGGLGEARRREHVRADVAVEPDEVDAVGGRRPLDGPLGIAVAEVEPELRIVLTGGDELVGVGVDPGRDPQQNVGRGSDPFLVEHVEAIELVEGVDDDVTHTRRDRFTQLVAALVVAVHHARRSGHAGGQRHVQLTAGRDVEQHPLLVREPCHRPAQERLRRVDGALVAERRRLPRGSVPGGALRRRRTGACRTRPRVARPSTTDRQPPVGADVGGVGKQSACERAHETQRTGRHICSGASMPSNPRP